MWAADSVTCRQVRALAAAAPELGGLPAARLRLSACLQPADLVPSGLPLGSVLLIRSFRHRAPPQFSASDGGILLDPGWERDAREGIAEYWRRAARPVSGTIDGTPDAVLFVDEAELIACLALALSRGEANNRWWWQTLLRRFPSTSEAALLKLWTEAARSVPAAVSALTRWDAIARVLPVLSASSAAAVARAIVTDWELPADLLVLPPAGIHAAASSSTRDLAPGSRSVDASSGATTSTYETPAHDDSPAGPPGLRRVLRALGSNSTEHRLLVALALALADRPEVPRVRRALALASGHQPPSEAWSQPPSNVSAKVAPQRRAPTERAFPAGPTRACSPSTPAVSHPKLVTTTEGADEPVPSKHQVDSMGGALASDEAPERKPGREIERDELREEVGADLPSPLIGGFSRQEARITPPAALVDERLLAPEPRWEEGLGLDSTPSIREEMEFISTELGGVFYLINVLTRYDPWPEAPMSRWDLLAATARGLLAEEALLNEGDALWRFLRQLSGSDGASQIGEEVARWPRHAVPDSWQRECSVVLPDDRTAASIPGVVPGFAHWLSAFLEFYRRRLALALACAPESVAATFLMASARANATSTHLGVRFPMSEISLETRRAGLDRDPGWRPAWGRIIQFQFE